VRFKSIYINEIIKGGYFLFKFQKRLVLLLLALILLLAACGNDANEESKEQSEDDNEATESSEDKGTIKIGMNNWVENIAVSNMWKVILEEKGYEIELVSIEKAALYEGMASGDLDIGMEIWLPETDKSYYEQYEDEIELQDNWYEGTELALTVPAYMDDINSMEDLNEYKDEFDSTITGIEPGASIIMLTEDAIEEYDLDYELQTSSEPAMLTELKTKMENEEPLVVTLWKPHSAYAELDLKNLEDPMNVYGDSENIYYATRMDFEDDHPEIVEWFNNFILDDDQLGTLMAEVESADSEEEGAKNWIEDNQDLIDEWIEE